MAHVYPVTLAAVLVTCAVAVARADAPKRIEVAPWCLVDAAHLGFHLAFPDGSRRTVVNLTCDRTSKTCAGATLRLAELDRGAPLGVLDLGAVKGAELTQSDMDASRVRWGGHAFTFNHRLRFVTFDGVRADCH